VLALIKQQPRSKEAVSEIVKAMHPIFDYYIKSYLIHARIFTHHDMFNDYYQDVYVECTRLAAKVYDEWGGADFNRIKRYFNKSVSGWVHNKVYLRKKKQVDIVVDNDHVLAQRDAYSAYDEVDYDTDMHTVEDHVNGSMGRYFELISALLGAEVYHKKNFYERRFRDTVFYKYLQTGQLMSADDFFRSKFGTVFGDNGCEE
jgi:hypothetical protein